MDVIQFFILQLIGHLFADFFFQTNELAENKNKLGFKSPFLKWHLLIVFLLSWFVSFQISFVFGALIIGVMHYLIDGLKKQLNRVATLRKYLFFIDQLLHIVILILVILLFNHYCEIEPIFNIKINTKYLLIILSYIIILKPANIFIKETFQVFDIEIPNNDDLPNAGKLIGILERALTLTFILLGQFEAVGFLIAAKSILRYKDDNPLKTEYVLIGTMLSFGIAVFTGVLINLL